MFKLSKQSLIIVGFCIVFSIIWTGFYISLFTFADGLFSRVDGNIFHYLDNVFKVLGLFIPSFLAFFASVAISLNKKGIIKTTLFILFFQIIWVAFLWL